MVNLRQLECFFAVADTLHFGRPAERPQRTLGLVTASLPAAYWAGPAAKSGDDDQLSLSRSATRIRILPRR